MKYFLQDITMKHQKQSYSASWGMSRAIGERHAGVLSEIKQWRHKHSCRRCFQWLYLPFLGRDINSDFPMMLSHQNFPLRVPPFTSFK